MKRDELIRCLRKEKEEARLDGGLCSNFLNLLTIPTQGKSAKSLYPSLANDSDADGALANAIKALEEQS